MRVDTANSGTYPRGMDFKLPEEILAEIFLLYKDLCRPQSGKKWFGHHVYSWLAVSLVCKFWHHVAINLPLLWRDIWVMWDGLDDQRTYVYGHSCAMTSATFIKLQLERSNGVPLHIVAGQRANGLLHPYIHKKYMLMVFHLLRSHMAHVEVMDITARSFALYEPLEMPLVRSLRLTLIGYAGRCGCDIVVSPTGDLSHLNTLYSHGFSFRYTVPYFRPTIKHLILEACIPGPSATQIVEALSEMPLLETLVLTGEPETTNLNFRQTTVVLSSLQSVSMNSDPLTCALVLGVLRFPTTALMKFDNSHYCFYYEPLMVLHELVSPFASAVREKMQLYVDRVSPGSVYNVELTGHALSVFRHPFNRDISIYEPPSSISPCSQVLCYKLHVESGPNLRRNESGRRELMPWTLRDSVFLHMLPAEIHQNMRSFIVDECYLYAWLDYSLLQRVEYLCILGSDRKMNASNTDYHGIAETFSDGILHLPLLHTLHLHQFRFQDIEPLQDLLHLRRLLGSSIRKLIITDAAGFSDQEEELLRKDVEEIVWVEPYSGHDLVAQFD